MKKPAGDLLRSFNLTKWWWIPLIPMAWFSLVWRIGEYPIQYWDESRLAVNAAEMLRTGSWLVTTYQNQPDLINTKPPLLVWLQALSLHAFGYSEWAFRLPTVFAAVALLVLVVGFSRRWLGGPLAGLLSGLALLTSQGFVADHVARSGDYETLLLLFLTAQVMAVFAWLHTQQRRYLLLGGIAIGLGILTKSVAGLFFLPGLTLELIRRRRLLPFLRQPSTWLAAAFALGIPLVWYSVREFVQPGYLSAVWYNELGGRFTKALDDTYRPWYYFLHQILWGANRRWTPWVLIAAWAIMRRPSHRPACQFLWMITCVAGPLLLIISTAATKCPWYDAPIYPFLALVIGGGLTLLVRRLTTSGAQPAFPYYSLLLLAIAFLPAGISLYRHMFDLRWQPSHAASLPYGRFLQQAKARPTHNYTLLSLEGYHPTMEFYALVAQHEYPADTVKVEYDYENNNLAAGQIVVVCGNRVPRIPPKCRLQLLYHSGTCKTYRIQPL